MKVSELANLLVMYDQDADVLVQEGAELYDFSVEHFDNPGWEDLVLLRKKDLKTPPIEEIDYDNEDMGTDMRKPKGSYLRNCCVNPRASDDMIFLLSDGEVYAFLDGYLITPLEQYEHDVAQESKARFSILKEEE